MDASELCYTPATRLSAEIRARRITPVEVVNAVLARIERVDRQINSYCTLVAEEARAAARAAEQAVMRGDDLGPLHGVPVSIKDLVITRGIRTTRGSKLYEDFVPDEDAPLVERLKGAGAIILGKTNTPEFGWKGATDNLIFGPTRNPWNLERSAGGSSGGAGAAVAAGLGPLAIGTDGGGSIRIPSSLCGIFGLKPHLGRVPMYPASNNETLSHSGPMTRTVRDAALLMDVLAGPDERDRQSLPAAGQGYLAACDEPLGRLRVAWSGDLGYAAVEPEVRRIAEVAAKRFSELGCEVEDAHPGFPNPAATFNVFYYSGLRALLAPYRPDKDDLLDPGLLRVLDKSGNPSAVQYKQAEFERSALWDTTRRFFERYDLLLTPTQALTAFPLGLDEPTEVAGQPIDDDLSWTPFTFPFNLTGQPAATVPGGWSAEGLPVGLQIVGRRFDEPTVLRAAAAFEALQPWAQRRPALD